MTTELRFLLLSCGLGLVHLLLTSACLVAQHGVAYGVSSRDEQKPLTGIGGRVNRAFANFLQSFPIFAAAVLAAHVLDRHSGLTAAGAQLYFWSRLAFVPLYAFGVIWVRSIVFGLSLLGIVLILIALV